ncbi:hypothetical protein ACXO2V_09005, partial [Lactobacillus delbrueckii subsp. bulgaricus]
MAPFGIVDCYNKYFQLKRPEEMRNKRYFLSIGRSNRDYDFLVHAWNDVDSYLVIASDKYNGENRNSKVIVKHDITADTQYEWINNA